GVERVVLHGLGEPLLARDLPAMVAEANRRGARVLFNTNALALHRRLAERLVAAGLRELRADRPRVSLFFMAMRENCEQLPAVIERAGSMGVHTVVVQRLVYFDT